MLLIKINSALKDFLLFIRLPLLLTPLRRLFKFSSNFSLLSSWIQQHKDIPFNDFYKPKRRYSDRVNLYTHVSDNYLSEKAPIHYLEFGVASGGSFKWWLNKNKHPQSRFWGFDTFEGLPEDWHFYKKGAMSHEMPQPDDERAQFVKGLFQDTLYDFLKNYRRPDTTEGTGTLVIHMDADLYSSTLFALTMLAPYLREGDIIMFDEFNVPNHEFAAWNDFVRSYYIKYEVLGAVNNFYQIACRLK